MRGIRLAKKRALSPGLLACVLTVACAGAAEERRTGERPVSPEEIARFKDASTRVARVAPNELGARRMLEAARLAGRRDTGAPAFVAKGAEFSAGASRAPDITQHAELPAAVDNGELPGFPPIGDQGDTNGCTHWATTYYMLTNNTAVVRGWNAREEPDKRFSPRWTYNATNMGKDDGGWTHKNMEYLRAFGSALKNDFDYANPDTPGNGDPGEYQELSADPELWRKALSYRPVDNSYFLGELDTEAGLRRLKAILANGYVTVFGTKFFKGWSYLPVREGAREGVNCAVAMTRTPYNGHAMTIVGYDDALWVDVNGNGRRDEGEVGALRIANSWGRNFQDKGFTWVLYDALRDRSRIPGFAPSGREPLIRDKTAYCLIGREEYEPLLMAELTMSCGRRGDVRASVALGRLGGIERESGWYWPPNYGDDKDNVEVALSGGGDSRMMTVYLDFTDFVMDSGARTWNVTVRDVAAGYPTRLERIRLLQWRHDGWMASEPHQKLPKEFDATGWYFYFSHGFGEEFGGARRSGGVDCEQMGKIPERAPGAR